MMKLMLKLPSIIQFYSKKEAYFSIALPKGMAAEPHQTMTYVNLDSGAAFNLKYCSPFLAMTPTNFKSGLPVPGLAL